ncbi:C-type mannose receptor 2-like isoform X2 [Cyprinodon tularosa]|uniref:C-type mannose receptor 2-like isoform X2 n=1 Tax=Cyprinodon tularosa TaxID=77115 RepID=UPI0018E28429|nr:C-type mannose receptor 2-like isoform X2 [Cyprinodon tularosa]
MMGILQFISAASLLCTASGFPKRHFHYVNEPKTWKEAQSHCREKYLDLAVITSLEDVTTLNNMVAWIGLYDDVNSWRWSYSDPNFYQGGEAEFRNWLHGEPNNMEGNEPCGAMWATGEWIDVSCEISMKTVCSDVEGRNASFIFINQTMSWAGAQSLCREHHTDLASVRSTSELEQIKELLQSVGEDQAWIGLYRNSWTWVDGSSFSFNHWASSEPAGPEENCAAAALDDGGRWQDWPCSSSMPFFCYEGPVFKQLVKVKLVKSSSLDLKDAAVLEDLLKKFEQKLKDSGVEGDVKLSWKEQSEGEIFLREE